MGCQKTKCIQCQQPYKACQLENGICSTCRENNQTASSNNIPVVTNTVSSMEVNNTNDVYYG